MLPRRPKQHEREQSFVRVQLSKLQTFLALLNARDLYVDIEEYEQGYVLPWGALQGALSPNKSGLLPLTGDITTASNTGTASNLITALTVPTGQIYFVMGIILSGTDDANVANRTWRVKISDALPAPAVASAASGATTAVTVTASQTLQIYMPPWLGYHWKNVNGTLTAVANENPIPFYLLAGGTVAAENTAANSQAADAYGITVKYIRVA